LKRGSKLTLSFLLIAVLYGYFISAAIHVEAPSAHSPVQFYSNQRRQDLPYTLRTLFKKATRSIHLTMYALTDPGIIQTLKASASRGVDVQVDYDPSATDKKLPNPIRSEPIKSRGLMHRKIVLIDDTLVFLGSANMTRASLALHDNLTCGFYHPGLAQFLRSSTQGSYTFKAGAQNATLWLLPDPTGEALRLLLQEIRQAKISISISMFTLTHPELVEALIQAHQRGVKVKLAIDYYAGRGASKKALDRLRAVGIPLTLSGGSQLLHHKWAYIDSKTLILGSTNWTKAAFTKNHDCLLFLYDLTAIQRKYMDKLWRVVELEAYK